MKNILAIYTAIFLCLIQLGLLSLPTDPTGQIVMTRVDAATYSNVAINISYDIRTKPRLSALNACLIFHGNSNEVKLENEERVERCKTLFEYTVHMDRIEWITKTYEHISTSSSKGINHFPHIDGLLFASSLLYDGMIDYLTLDKQLKSTKRVCIFGSFDSRLASIILLADPSYHLIYVADESADHIHGLKDFEEFSVRLKLVKSMSQFHSFIGDELCDVFHVRNFIHYNLLSVYGHRDSFLMLETLNRTNDISGYGTLGLFYPQSRSIIMGMVTFPIPNKFILSRDSQGFAVFNYDVRVNSEYVSCITTTRFVDILKSEVCDVEGNARPLTYSKLNDTTYADVIHIIITYPSRLFEENAFGLERALKLMISRYHYTDVISVEVVGSNPLSYFRNSSITLQIAFGCHYPALYLTFYICFQTEQPWSYVLQNHRHIAHTIVAQSVMRNAQAIFTTSHTQALLIENILNNDFSNENDIQSFYIPFYTKRLHTTDAHDFCHNSSASFQSLPSAFRQLDIFAYGACTMRRHLVFVELEKFAFENQFTSKFICASNWSQAIFDFELDRLLLNTRLVINIHAFDNSSLQTHRIMHLLSLGKCVLSERSTIDRSLDSDYATSLIFMDDLEDLKLKIELFLHYPEELMVCERNSWQKYREVECNVSELNRAITTVRRNLIFKDEIAIN